MEEATARYEEQLDGEALEYLEGRGVSEQVARSHRLGRIGDPTPGYEQYRGRLVIPYLTPTGVVTLRFRDMSGKSKAKYLSRDGASPRLYNVAALHTGLPHVAIVEGEFKAIALTEAGLPTVGVPGTQTWLPHHPRCFVDFERVYIVGDNDVKLDDEGVLKPNYGQQLASRIIRGDKTTPPLRNAINIVGPENLDVDDWLLRDGPDVVLGKIGARPEAEVPEFDPDTPPF